MSGLTFTLKANTIAIDCRKLTPDALAGLSVTEINQLKLESTTVADVFDVTGTDASHITFKNASALLNYVGYKMKVGQITVQGDVGDYLGAEMQGGTIVCSGSAGERTADKMRRGIILIDGDTGSYCCSRMIAGTVGIYGKAGAHLGYALRRGTILLTQKTNFSSTWLDCGLHTLPFLKLLFKAFKPLDSKFATLNSTRVQRLMGDASQTGKGEILLFQ
jgi:formylmethanofuran dehydrogenase subunit C